MNNSTITLDPRIFDNGLKTPIPPPRKKRSTLRKGCTLPAAASSTLSSSDSSDRAEDELRNSTQSLPSRKLKVGNKKSDKILGESLSDHLSDEPVDSPQSRASSTAAADEVDKSASTMSDQKLSFLLNMLEEEQKQKQSNEQQASSRNEDDDGDDEELYKNKTPVEEPLFVARKKVTKHICDDDEHIHEFIEHEHNHDDEPPKKPERDFSKYQQQQQNNSIDEIQKLEDDDENAKVVVVNGKVRKTLSRENLPTPPEVPSQRRSTGANEFISAPIIKVDESSSLAASSSLDEVKTSPRPVNRTISLNLSSVQQHSEGQSSDNEDVVPQTAPILTTHAIVEKFNFVPSCPDIHPIVTSDSAKKVKFDETQVDPCKSTSSVECEQSTEPSSSHDVTLKSEMNSSMNDIIEEIYSRNSEIMKEFHSYLEPPKKVGAGVKFDDENVIEHDENVQVIAVKNNDTNHSEGVRVGAPASEQEVNEDDDDDKRRYSDSFESTDEDDLVEKTKSRKFNKNTTTLVSIQIQADDNAAVKSDDKRSQSEHAEKMTSESFSDLPIFKSIVEETVTNTREFIREKSPDHSTLLKLLNDKPSTSE